MEFSKLIERETLYSFVWSRALSGQVIKNCKINDQSLINLYLFSCMNKKNGTC